MSWYWHSAGGYWTYNGERATPPSGEVTLQGRVYYYHSTAQPYFTEVVIPPSGTGTWQVAPPTPAPAPVPVAQIVGAYTGGTAASFITAESTLGALKTTRLFYSGQLPGSFAGSQEAQLPAGVLPVVSYKTPGTNVTAYVKSVTRPLVLIFHHEPENDFATGAEFTTAFVAQSKLIRSAGNGNVKVAMAALGYRYRAGGNAANGAYIPPADSVDYYAIDVYQHQTWDWPSQGLADYDQWLNWLACVRDRGKPLAVTEYGIDDAGGGNAARNERLQADAAYLRQTFNGKLAWFSYWYANTSYTYKFIDPATVATWKALAAGTL